MKRGLNTRWSGDRGAVLVHVAVAMVALVAFSALAVDYGVMWSSRRQAQNAADAAALSGAISLAFDSPTDFTRARASAETTGRTNAIFGLQPDITRGTGFSTDITQDISFPPTDTPSCPSSGATDTCVRVNVYRTASTLSGGPKDPLPTFFAPLFGRTEQGTRATATAVVRTGNATDCLRPWAVADRWEENVKRVCSGNLTPPCQSGSWVDNTANPWTTDDFFDKWNRTGNPPTLNTDIIDSGNQYDYYQAPTEDDPGTGFGLYNPDGSLKDYGQPLRMKMGSNNDPISSGWFLSLDLSAQCTAPGCPTNQGSNIYRYAIQNCVGGTVGIGDTLPVETGNMVGPTDQGVYSSTGQQPLSLYERDPGATWNAATQSIDNSCAPGICADGLYYGSSPRIVPIALFNADTYLGAGYNGSNGQVTVTNLFGFFIISQAQGASLGLATGNQNGTVYGVMVAVPGFTRNTTTTTSSFLREIILVR